MAILDNEMTYFWASSSLVYTSGYWDLWNARSKSSSCSPVNVVLLRRCLRFKWKPGSDSVSESSALLGPLNRYKKLEFQQPYTFRDIRALE